MKIFKLFVLFLLYSFSSPAQEPVLNSVEEKLKNGDYLEVRNVILNSEYTDSTNFLSLLGEVNLRLGRLEEAEEVLQKALERLENSSYKNTELYSNTLNRFALVLWNQGQDTEAQSYMSRTIDIRNQLYPDNEELLAASFNDLGLITARANPYEALQSYEKALDLYHKAFGKTSEKYAQGLINLGIIYSRIKLFNQATEKFTEARPIIRSLHPNGHPTEAFILANMGQNFKAMNIYSEAMGAYEEALELYRKHYGLKHPEVANLYNLTGQILLEQSQYDKALYHFQKALVANSADFISMSLTSYPALDDYYQPYTMISSLLYKARAYQQMHFNKTLKLKHLKEALTAIEKSDSLIVALRHSINTEDDKLTLNTLASDIYEEAVNLCVLISERSLVKQPYYEKAYYFNEKNKASILQEAVAETRAKEFAGIPHDILDAENELKIKINFIEQQLASKPRGRESDLRSELFNLKREYQNFISMLEEQYPSYYDLKYKEISPDINELQANLDNETAIISYLSSESLNKLFIFIITKNKYKVITKPIDRNYHRNIFGLRNGIYFRDKETYLLTAKRLGNLLIPKLPSKIKHLVIIPEGHLGKVPFEALLTKRVAGLGFSSLPYLIKEFRISYAYSSSLFLSNVKKSSPAFNNRYGLLMAPVVFDYDNFTLPPLPGTEEECKSIGIKLKNQSINVDLFLNGEAVESSFKEVENKKYAFIHLATHGLINERQPALSRLYFGSGKDDGRLYTPEIYNLKIESDLVTLSACETGLGKLSKGEGVLGFTRALLYAGAKNIVVSLWRVSDTSTANFMVDFYGYILQSRDYGQSLQFAKREMINDSKYAEPYYWAPFLLFGR